MAGLSSWWRSVTGRGAGAVDVPAVPPVPGPDRLRAALDELQADVRAAAAGGRLPELVVPRVDRICTTVRETLPRLDALGPGSREAHSVRATVTDYLPGSLGGYLRLPRSFADHRPVDRGRTALMVLVDDLDLLAATMDGILDAACRGDGVALVAHADFLAEKFGRSDASGPTIGGVP